ncbi:MAG TPA: hypothetical protein VKT77_14405 [Chthonomonadaceae bacterium]|nr:hypothetical protein [Chthonomonadaceae bacterium]
MPNRLLMFVAAVAAGVALGRLPIGQDVRASTMRHAATGPTPDGDVQGAAREIGGAGRTRITQVRLFGWTDRATLTVRSDGTATCLMNRRDERGRVGQYFGHVADADFRRIAFLLMEARYDTLPQRSTRPYPTIRDAFTLDITHGDATSAILADSTAPAKLLAVRDALRALGARVSWKRVNSGVRGVLIGPSFESADTLSRTAGPLAGTLLVVRDPASDAAIVAVDTDVRGRFDVPLPPGAYRLQANVDRPGVKSGEGVPTIVTVRKGRPTKVVLQFRPLRP